MKTFDDPNFVNFGLELYRLICDKPEGEAKVAVKVGKTIIEAIDVMPSIPYDEKERRYLLRFDNEAGTFNVGLFCVFEIRELNHWGVTIRQEVLQGAIRL